MNDLQVGPLMQQGVVQELIQQVQRLVDPPAYQQQPRLKPLALHPVPDARRGLLFFHKAPGMILPEAFQRLA